MTVLDDADAWLLVVDGICDGRRCFTQVRAGDLMLKLALISFVKMRESRVAASVQQACESTANKPHSRWP
jgi:hypothetical protein